MRASISAPSRSAPDEPSVIEALGEVFGLLLAAIPDVRTSGCARVPLLCAVVAIDKLSGPNAPVLLPSSR
jgi:hypothetical protein